MTAPLQRPAAWQPLVQGDAAERALHVVREIAEALRQRLASPEAAGDESAHYSLGGGDAGIALFFAYLAEAFPDEGYDETALELLEQAVDGMGRFESRPALYGGFPGVAWVVEHLQGRLLDPADGDPSEEVIASLEPLLARAPWRQDFDLIVGLVGLGVLALERRPRSLGDRCLELVMTRLGELAEHVPAGTTWRSQPQHLTAEMRALYPEGHFNLGVAHGVPGVIALLGEAVAAGVERDRARTLLEGAVAWLLAQEQPPETGSRYAYSVDPRGGEPKPTRLAWCYGDLGISLALLAAARSAGEPDWEGRALTIARAAAARSPAASGVVDFGLCHGAAGAAHLFNRLYQATGEPVFADTSRFWLDQALGMRRDGQGIAGFQAYVPDERGEIGWHDDPGLLTGVAGLGLALLAASTPIEPAWDRVLLVSIPAWLPSARSMRG